MSTWLFKREKRVVSKGIGGLEFIPGFRGQRLGGGGYTQDGIAVTLTLYLYLCLNPEHLGCGSDPRWGWLISLAVILIQIDSLSNSLL